MNKFLRSLLVRSLVVSALVALAIAGITPARADFTPYVWLVKIETEPAPNKFAYPGSTLAPLVKARVTYEKIGDNSGPAKYETIWYCNGKAYGLERYAPLSIDPGVSVGIKVTHKSGNPSPADYKAEANSILRMLVDLRLNRSMLTTVIIADDAFGTVTNELANEHYIPLVVQVGVAFLAPGAIFVQDESDKRTETLWYSPNH